MDKEIDKDIKEMDKDNVENKPLKDHIDCNCQDETGRFRNCKKVQFKRIVSKLHKDCRVYPVFNSNLMLQ